MKKIIFTFLLIVTVAGVKAAITTPYPTTIEVKQINSAEKERQRLRQTQKKYDKQPTGFYVSTGQKVVVNVEIIEPADNNVMPVLTIGTLGFNVDGRNTGTHTTLKTGINTITNHSGGLIWLSFVQDEAEEPKGVAKITFTNDSEQVRVPRFIHGTTTNMEFSEMLVAYNTPDVLFQSDFVVVIATKEAANLYSKDINKVEWLNRIHTLIEKEDEISGLDNNDQNPLHHRHKAGEVRHLLVENTYSNPHASSAGYTGYPSGSRHRYLTNIGVQGNNSWMLGHEIGHQHQQSAYLINKATESTVNIYSYVVERNIQGETYNRTSAERWTTARNTYLRLPLSKRIYDMEDTDLQTITGFNHDELRFMPWEQFFLVFGDQFYKTLHRVVREEKVFGVGADERRSYLIWKASQVTGYDLTEFFNQWGIRVTNSAVKADLRAKIAFAKENSEILDLSAIGRTADDLVRVTGQALPEWAPIAMRGITTSEPEGVNRSSWTVVTSYEGVADAAVGGDLPEYIIDDSNITSFAFVKPGKSYGGVSVPSTAVPSFTVDMKEKETFNYITYMHRFSGNTYEWLRAREISVYGSNDGMQFTLLKERHVIDHTVNANEIYVDVPKSTYRYVRVVIENWNKDSGSTIQVTNFNIGTKLPTPDPLKFNVKVTADEGIVTSQTGDNYENEDSNFTIEFSLASGRTLDQVLVDGEVVAPTQSNDIYKLNVKVSNHLDVNISSKVLSGIETVFDHSYVNISPNPAKAGEPIILKLDNEFSDAAVRIFSLTGALTTYSKAKGNNAELIVQNPGLYIVETRNGSKTNKQKIIVR